MSGRRISKMICIILEIKISPCGRKDGIIRIYCGELGGVYLGGRLTETKNPNTPTNPPQPTKGKTTTSVRKNEVPIKNK